MKVNVSNKSLTKKLVHSTEGKLQPLAMVRELGLNDSFPG